MTDFKASLYRTARARIGCARFPAGVFVAVRYTHTGDNGTRWFEITGTEDGPIDPVAYPQHHLTDFVL